MAQEKEQQRLSREKLEDNTWGNASFQVMFLKMWFLMHLHESYLGYMFAI